jgi:hypothetical protein
MIPDPLAIAVAAVDLVPSCIAANWRRVPAPGPEKHAESAITLRADTGDRFIITPGNPGTRLVKSPPNA